MLTPQTALDALQSGLENVARVIDVHGDCATAQVEDEPDEPIYDLEIAADYLRQAEEILENDSVLTLTAAETDYLVGLLHSEKWGLRGEEAGLNRSIREKLAGPQDF